MKWRAVLVGDYWMFVPCVSLVTYGTYVTPPRFFEFEAAPPVPIPGAYRKPRVRLS